MALILVCVLAGAAGLLCQKRFNEASLPSTGEACPRIESGWEQAYTGRVRDNNVLQSRLNQRRLLLIGGLNGVNDPIA
jgi:hypothetical protein